MSSVLTASPTQGQITVSPRRAAVTAGLAYAVIIVLGLFANFFARARLIEPDDAAATVRNLIDSEMLFRSGVTAFIVVFVADVVVAWGLYVLFQQTNRELSLFAAWFRLVYVAIGATALLGLLVALKLVDDAGYITALEQTQRDAQVMLALDAYVYGWDIGLVFFGVHLLLLGLVMVKSNYAPRVLGLMVTLAGLAYTVTTTASALLPDFEHYRGVFLVVLGVVAIPAEFGLTVWLLWKGGRTTDRRPAPVPAWSSSTGP